MTPTYLIQVDLSSLDNQISITGISSLVTSVISTVMIGGPQGIQGIQGIQGEPGTPGTTIHSALSDLDYASAGHTGFEPAKGVDDYYVSGAEKTTWNAKQNALIADVDYLVPTTAATTYEPKKGADDNYVTDAEKIVIGNTSGTNTGDQNLSGYELLANKVTSLSGSSTDIQYPSAKLVYDQLAGKQASLGYTPVNKAGDTMTGALIGGGLITASAGLVVNGTFRYDKQSADTFSDGLTIRKRGTTGDATAATTNNSEIGYHTFNGWDGISAYRRLAYVIVRADGATTPTTGGGNYRINVRDSAGTEADRLIITSAETKPGADSAYALGSGSAYWSNTYTDRLSLNSTAYLDGAVVGELNAYGNIVTRNIMKIATADGISADTTAGIIRLSGGILNDGAMVLLGGSTHATIPNIGIGRIGVTDIFKWNTTGMTIGSGNLPTHTLTLPSTATGITLYNTADQTTNLERLRIYSTGSQYNIISDQGGTGVQRNISISAGAAYGGLVLSNSHTGLGFIRSTLTTSASGSVTHGISGTLSASSGTQYGLVISPTYTQSGTAAGTDLLINRTETSTGSGAKLLIDAQVGGVSKFKVSNTGLTTVNSLTSQSVIGFASGAVGTIQNYSSGGVQFKLWNGSTDVYPLTVGSNMNITLADTANLVLGTTTGTKIATVGGASGQKMAFWGSTPIVQPVFATGASHTVDELITVLQTLGLVRQS